MGLSSSSALAQTQFEVPRLTGPVMDEAGILNPAEAQQLSAALQDFNQMGKAQVQIYVVKSLQGIPIEQASIQIVDHWKLGDAKKDNGLLFLVAPNEHKMRFEVGQGLEGVIPDILAKQIQVDYVIPYFKENKYSEGIIVGTSQILSYIDADFMRSHPELEGKAPPRRKSSKRGIPLWLILLIFIGIPFLNRFGGGRRGRGGGGFYGGGGFGGGSSGGSSWSGGGGGFSGGGASSGW